MTLTSRTIEKKELRAKREAELGKRQRALPDKRFGVIYADPPWRFEPYSRVTGMDRAAGKPSRADGNLMSLWEVLAVAAEIKRKTEERIALELVEAVDIVNLADHLAPPEAPAVEQNLTARHAPCPHVLMTPESWPIRQAGKALAP